MFIFLCARALISLLQREAMQRTSICMKARSLVTSMENFGGCLRVPRCKKASFLANYELNSYFILSFFVHCFAYVFGCYILIRNGDLLTLRLNAAGHWQFDFTCSVEKWKGGCHDFSKFCAYLNPSFC